MIWGQRTTAAWGAVLLLGAVAWMPARGAAEEDAAEDAKPNAALAASDQSEAVSPRSAAAAPAVADGTVADGQPAPHPLRPVLQRAAEALRRFDSQVQQYTCLMIKRERIDGQLMPHQFLQVKIRERQQDGDRLVTPLSIYARFLKPTDVEGRELLYVENQRNGDLLVRRGGPQLPNLTLQLDPHGPLAMSQSRYPITHIGIRMLITQMMQRIEEQMQYGSCEVTHFDDAKLDGRPCDHIQVRHHAPRPELPIHSARVLIDRQLQLPVYFASYSWPDRPGDPPVLEEEYVYTRVQINPGLTDLDFDPANPRYRFRDLTADQTAAK